MLDLESTIKHCEEMAEKNEEMCRVEELMGLGLQNTEMMKCARTYKQLAEWLKELKQLKEQEPCEDCISRAEAIKGLGEQPLVWTDSNSEIQQLLDWREHKEMLEKLPSVGQKVGHWIVEIWNNREHHTCSECQRMVDYEPCYHYCPYCGAKLSEVEE